MENLGLGNWEIRVLVGTHVLMSSKLLSFCGHPYCLCGGKRCGMGDGGVLWGPVPCDCRRAGGDLPVEAESGTGAGLKSWSQELRNNGR